MSVPEVDAQLERARHAASLRQADPSEALALAEAVLADEASSEPATVVAEWVFYMSPVTATQELILRDADAAEEEGAKGRANKLRATAESPYLFPDEEFLARTSFGRPLETDEEAEEWDATFSPIYQA